MDRKQIEEIFELLFENSRQAIERKEVPVSCCIAEQNSENGEFKIIAVEHNLTNVMKNATKHCEILCLEKAIEAKCDLSQCVILVTVEPCLMCGYALKLAKITKAYYILPNDKFGGIESLFNINLNCEKIDYNKETVLGFLRGFYQHGNDKLEPEKRHRFKKRDKTPLPEKKIKEN